MYSVTQRANSVSQPYGGYVKPSSFQKTVLEDGIALSDLENIHAALIGIAVDYLSRFLTGAKKEEAFKTSLIRAQIISEERNAQRLLNGISGEDDTSIINACKLAGYDVCLRVGRAGYKPVEGINPNTETINNVRIMVNRSIVFFNTYGPVVDEGMTFPSGYTKLVSSGDADFMTADTLWDFKVSKHSITSKQTLQLLMYYIMGIHSAKEKYKAIEKIGFFNPRLNTVYLKEIKDISKEVMIAVENDVIGYNGNDLEIMEQTVQNKTDDKTEKPVQQKEENQSEILTITDLMKILDCSRYTVMKLYTEQGLPLEKKANRYQITQSAYERWVYQRQQMIEEKRRNATKKNLIFGGVLVGVIVLTVIMFLLFNKSFGA